MKNLKKQRICKHERSLKEKTCYNMSLYPYILMYKLKKKFFIVLILLLYQKLDPFYETIY